MGESCPEKCGDLVSRSELAKVVIFLIGRILTG